MYSSPQRVDLPFGWGTQLSFTVKPLGKQTAGAPGIIVHLLGFVAPSTSVKSAYGTDDDDDDEDNDDELEDDDDDDEEDGGECRSVCVQNSCEEEMTC